MMERFDILSNLQIEFIPIQTIFPSMVAVAMALGGNRFCRKLLYDPQTFKV